MFHGSIRERLALTKILLAPGGERLSLETAQWCAQLLMPDKKDSAIEYAKSLGTYNKADRSQQYEGRYSNEILKRNDDLLFQRQREMEDRHFKHEVILAVITLAPSIAALVLTLLK